MDLPTPLEEGINGELGFGILARLPMPCVRTITLCYFATLCVKPFQWVILGEDGAIGLVTVRMLLFLCVDAV